MPGKTATIRTTIFALLGAMLALACSSDNGKQVVLKIDDSYTLTLAEYKAMADKRFNGAEIAKTEPIKSHESYLNEILLRQLKVIDGRHKGFDNDPDVQKAYDDALKRAAITKLYNDEILSKVVPEQMIRDFYDNDTEEIHASHILLRMQPGDSDSVAIKARIDSLYQVATHGGDFAKLAQEYNQDNTSPNGDIGWFRHGAMVKPFEDAAFALKPGDVSKPVRTRYGWHIIKLHERRPVKDKPSYHDDKERIAQMLYRQNGPELVKAANGYIENLNEQRKVAIDSAAVEKVFERIKGQVNTPDIFSLLTSDEQNIVLATLDGGSTQIKVSDIRDYVNRGMGRMRRLDSADTLIQLLKNYLAESILLPEAAKKAGDYTADTVIKAAKDAADQKIYQIVQQKMVTNQVSPTDDEIKAYFDAHPEKYMTQEQFTLIECLVKDKKLATEIFHRAQGGENLRKLSAKYSIRKDAKKRNGVFGPIRASQEGQVGRMASQAKIGQLVGPVKIGQNYSVFRVISKEEPRLEDYARVKERVRNDVRNTMRQKVQSAFEDSLKQAIDYTINLDVIKRAYPNAKAANSK